MHANAGVDLLESRNGRSQAVAIIAKENYVRIQSLGELGRASLPQRLVLSKSERPSFKEFEGKLSIFKWRGQIGGMIFSAGLMFVTCCICLASRTFYEYRR